MCMKISWINAMHDSDGGNVGVFFSDSTVIEAEGHLDWKFKWKYIPSSITFIDLEHTPLYWGCDSRNTQRQDTARSRLTCIPCLALSCVALFPPPCQYPTEGLNTSSVFHNISLSTVMRCEGRQKCLLHLRIKTELQLTGTWMWWLGCTRHLWEAFIKKGLLGHSWLAF